jgi:hypothetical protein
VGPISCPETSVKSIATRYVISQKSGDLIETERVYCAVRTGSWHTIRVTAKFKAKKQAARTFNPSKPSGIAWLIIQQFYVCSVQTVYLCVLCGAEKKQRLFPYTALTGRFL